MHQFGKQTGFQIIEYRPYNSGASLTNLFQFLITPTMNGEILSPVHGYPLRLLMPGYIGAHSVTWLSDIQILEQPSTNYFQTHSYQLFPAQALPQTTGNYEGRMLRPLVVNSFICQPHQDSALPASLTRFWAMLSIPKAVILIGLKFLPMVVKTGSWTIYRERRVKGPGVCGRSGLI
jgi:DMSO/TMAO reductase YedYZ molybdopterin-dependent catalytic subunit